MMLNAFNLLLLLSVTISNCRPNNSTDSTQNVKSEDNICIDKLGTKLVNSTQGFCPFLLFSSRQQIKRFDLNTRLVEDLSIPGIENVVPIEYDILNDCLFWADIKTYTIEKRCLNDNTTETLMLYDRTTTVEGLAYDWISHHLYFTDSRRAKIEIIQTDSNSYVRMRKIILDSNVLTKPRDIVIHPIYGYLFWSDWSRDNPCIGRSNLDGSNIKILFKAPEVYWPNGVTIDYTDNKIYWVDAREDYIGESDFDGNNFRKVLEKNDFVQHPFAISTIGNYIYWNDWRKKALILVDKGVRSIEVLLEKDALMGLKAYGDNSQKGTNACANATCKYLCVGMPNQHYNCLCPNGMEMINDTCMCPGNIIPFTNMTCPKPITCKSDEFQCGSGTTCILNAFRCDMDIDCEDGSDELNCTSNSKVEASTTVETISNNMCKDKQFRCSSGTCIPNSMVCDGSKDCLDGDDEISCEN